MSAGVARLADAVRRYVEPGLHLHFASTPSRSNAAIREVARAFRGQRPELTLSTSGFHSSAHLLGLLRLGRRYLACFFGDNYPAPRPSALYAALEREGATLEQWSLWTYVCALRAGALGHDWAVTNSLAGTELGAALARAGRYAEVPDPASPDGSRRVGLVAALRPDVTFVHAAGADEEGNVLLSPPYSEGHWGALAARRGVIATVEQAPAADPAGRLVGALQIPAHRVLAICVEPWGAHPQPLWALPAFETRRYRDDFEHYARWRQLTEDAEAFAGFTRAVLDAPDGGAAYRAWVGMNRLRALADVTAAPPAAAVAAPTRASVPPAAGAAATDASWVDRLVVSAARRIEALVRAGGFRVALAGIGHAFLAARLAQLALAEAQVRLAVMVEIGLYDVACDAGTSGFLLAWDNVDRARRLSSVEDVLGTHACGAANACLGILGAAQVDGTGSLNSSRLADGRPLVGSGGACDVAAAAAEVMVLSRADPARLVRAVDFVTSPGARVRSIVTDLGTLVRDGAGADWRLDALAPAACAEGARPVARPAPEARRAAAQALAARCGWTFDIPDEVPPPAAITPVERDRLEALDPDGSQRRRAA